MPGLETDPATAAPPTAAAPGGAAPTIAGGRTPRAVPSLDEIAAGVRTRDRAMLARAITLVESRRPDHRAQAQALLTELMPDIGNAHRIGITGVPGVGKSTFIETFGSNLTGAGHRVAVLAVDPSSVRTGGSILADKTRMTRLSNDPSAFIRPSPSAGTLGGVTRTTRETMMLCEAAGFDVILVETVGVGQSETIVADMVDFFLVLMLPGAGDALQGIKKGVLERADLIAVNKSDGDNAGRARDAANEYRHALQLVTPETPSWSPPVVVCSGRANIGLDELWRQVLAHRAALDASGELAEKRRRQRLRWMWSMLEDRLLGALTAAPAVRDRLPAIERGVLEGTLPPTAACDALLAAFGIGADTPL